MLVAYKHKDTPLKKLRINKTQQNKQTDTYLKNVRIKRYKHTLHHNMYNITNFIITIAIVFNIISRSITSMTAYSAFFGMSSLRQPQCLKVILATKVCSSVQRPPLPQDGTYCWLCPAGNKSTVIMILLVDDASRSSRVK